MKSLANISHYKDRLLLTYSIPVFLSQLPTDNEDAESTILGTTKKSYINVLKALSQLAVEPLLFGAFALEAMKNLDVYIAGQFAFYLNLQNLNINIIPKFFIP